MCKGQGPIGATKGKQINTIGLVPSPPPPSAPGRNGHQLTPPPPLPRGYRVRGPKLPFALQLYQNWRKNALRRRELLRQVTPPPPRPPLKRRTCAYTRQYQPASPPGRSRGWGGHSVRPSGYKTRHHAAPQNHIAVRCRVYPPDPPDPPPPPCVTFRLVVAPLRGPGQSPALPFACCVGSLRSVGRCGRCSCWCRPPPPPHTHTKGTAHSKAAAKRTRSATSTPHVPMYRVGISAGASWINNAQSLVPSPTCPLHYVRGHLRGTRPRHMPL